MANETVYLKAERNTEVQSADVFLRDVAKIRCANPHIEAKVKAIKIHNFSKNKEKKCVISILKIVSMIEEVCPGVQIESLGEADILVELVNVNRHKGWQQGIKIVIVALVSFFGTAFTIMAYHIDVQIRDVFGMIYQMVMGKESTGITIMEIAYSIGLAAGIILFFNHVGGRRITKDPTPIEVHVKKELSILYSEEQLKKLEELRKSLYFVGVEQFFDMERLNREMNAIRDFDTASRRRYRYSQRYKSLGVDIIDSVNIVL